MNRSLLLVLVLVLSTGAAEATPRYALVVGMNEGSRPDGGGPLPALRFAERDARSVRDAMIAHARVDADRVELVTGGDRKDVLAAAERLAAKRREDVAHFGDLASLFVVYFTGHGRDGALLTSGNPINAADIESLRAQMGADLMVAVFDTCESADALPKGAVAGTNPIHALPDHVVDAAGTVWIASASRGEFALEDREGGLFTRHFVEAFTRAPEGPVGRALDDMFEYARSRTLRDAETLHHRQTPRIRINLTRTAPLWMSYLSERSAKLVFDEDVEGTFIISYADDTLLERIVKPVGDALEVSAYAGRIKVYRAKGVGRDSMPWAEFRLGTGEEARIRPTSSARGADEVEGVRFRGDVGVLVDLGSERPRWGLGVGYSWSRLDPNALGVEHRIAIGARFATPAWDLDAALRGGTDRASFETWGYDLQETGLELGLGRRVFEGAVAVAFRAEGALLFLAQEFEDGASRRSLGASGWLGLDLELPLPGPLVAALRVGSGLRWTSGLGVESGKVLVSTFPEIGLAIRLPLGHEGSE